jgi:peptidoglycan hydrolase-like protein with peptidoglycan-binding domain
MKRLLTVGMLLICTVTIATAQSPANRTASPGPDQIKDAERRLSDLGYWAGPVDGRFDASTSFAVIAFQKWEGRSVTGRLTLDELTAIQNAAAPKPRELGYAHAEVDLDRQVLLLVNDEGSIRVLPVSTGNGKEFVDEGQTSVAYTPRGRFLVYRKGTGWETGSLGSVYYPNDISGGVAIHGSRNVPSGPASHGCIRVPMFAARDVSKFLQVGTIVLVYDQTSFVSGKEWAENPKLKAAALASMAATDNLYETKPNQPTTTSLARKKTRAKMIRA